MSVAIVSLAVGLLAGWIGQRSRFCSIGGLRDLIFTGDTALLRGLLALFVAAWFLFPVTVLLSPEQTPQLAEVTASQAVDDPGMIEDDEPAFWASLISSFSRLDAVIFVAGIGLGFVSLLIDGCPFRQHVLAGQGRVESMVYLGGFYVAALLFHWWSTPLLRLIF